MAVKIKDLLTLKLLKDARVITGVDGLDHVVNRISFSDGPISDDVLNYSNILSKGDMFINGLYSFIDNEAGLLKLFKFLHQTGAAGMFIVDEYMNTLPPSVLEFAEENTFPIIFIDRNIPYGQIIETSMEMILMNKSQTIAEMSIDNLLKTTISKDEIQHYAKRINGSFGKYYASINFSIETNSPITRINMIQELQNSVDSELMRYKGGFLAIINFEKQSELTSYIAYLKSLIEAINPDYKIGISNVFSSINNFNICIKQSVASLEMSNILSVKIIYYKELKLYKILYPLRDSVQMQEFYNDIFLTIQNFDKTNNLDLVNTIECFIANNGDYKKTALELHQHHNTIRYRINKAKTILDLEDSLFEFIEQFSVALKINKMMQH